MKALMGKLAQKIRSDKKGLEQLKNFLNSDKESVDITLLDGITYVVSRTKPRMNDK